MKYDELRDIVRKYGVQIEAKQPYVGLYVEDKVFRGIVGDSTFAIAKTDDTGYVLKLSVYHEVMEDIVLKKIYFNGLYTEYYEVTNELVKKVIEDIKMKVKDKKEQIKMKEIEGDFE